MRLNFIFCFFFFFIFTVLCYGTGVLWDPKAGQNIVTHKSPTGVLLKAKHQSNGQHGDLEHAGKTQKRQTTKQQQSDPDR